MSAEEYTIYTYLGPKPTSQAYPSLAGCGGKDAF